MRAHDHAIDAAPAAAPGRLRRAAGGLYRMAGAGSLALTWLYGLGFVANVVVPKGLDSAAVVNVGAPLFFDLGLLAGCLALCRRLSRRLRRDSPHAARSQATRALLLAAAFGALFVLWQPLHGVIWHVRQPALATLLHGAFALGACLVLLQGLRRGHLGRGRLARTGLLLALWAAPTMSTGHLIFSLAASLALCWPQSRSDRQR